MGNDCTRPHTARVVKELDLHGWESALPHTPVLGSVLSGILDAHYFFCMHRVGSHTNGPILCAGLGGKKGKQKDTFLKCWHKECLLS